MTEAEAERAQRLLLARKGWIPVRNGGGWLLDMLRPHWRLRSARRRRVERVMRRTARRAARR